MADRQEPIPPAVPTVTPGEVTPFRAPHPATGKECIGLAFAGPQGEPLSLWMSPEKAVALGEQLVLADTNGIPQ